MLLNYKKERNELILNQNLAAQLILILFITCTSFCLHAQQKHFFLEKEGVIKLPLNKEVGFHLNYIQFWELNNNKYIALGYPNELKINIYNWKDKSLFKSIQFKELGQDGVGLRIGGFCLLENNELAILSYYNQQIAIFDMETLTIKRRIDLQVNDLQTIIEPSVYTPIIAQKNKLYMGGTLEGHKQNRHIKPIVTLDLATENQSSIGPALNLEKNHFYHMLYFSNFDFNEDVNKFVISHSISPSIYLTDFEESYTYDASSKYIADFPSLPNDKDIMEFSKVELDILRLESHYKGIKYDSFRKMYYRIVFSKRTLAEDASFISRKFSLIALDENFKKLTEIDIPEHLNPEMFFISEEGLHFANESLYYKDPSYLTFETFLIQEKKEK